MTNYAADPRVQAYVAKIVKLEAGYVDNPYDKGGPTKWGITEKVARAQGYKGNMKDLPQSKAREIYLQNYWYQPRISELAAVAPEVAWEVFEAGVNLGTGTGIKFLQRALNAFNKLQTLYLDLKVDGVLGSKTLQALKLYFEFRKGLAEPVLLKALNCLQGSYYLELAESRETDETFVFGWINKRIALRN
jgi:lysozyme family protein